MIMIGRIKRFLSLKSGEKLFFFEAFFSQVVTGFILKVIPFRWIPGFFSGPSKIRTKPSDEILGEIRNSLDRAGYVSPWRNKCLVKTLAGRCMLNRRGINSTVCLGVAKDSSNKTLAHAWLVAEGFEIVFRGDGYIEIKSF